jgi:phosphopentomutase
VPSRTTSTRHDANPNGSSSTCTNSSRTRSGSSPESIWVDRRPITNLVDFDTQYGHRNDVDGYARNLERFDGRLQRILPRLEPDDLLILTADHGNDPTTAGTDHSREYVPLLVAGACVRPGLDLGTRQTFADVGQTLAEMFGVGPLANGTSFLDQIHMTDLTVPSARL